MKALLLYMIILFVLSTQTETFAQKDNFGIGVIIGAPTGLSAKLWVNEKNAIAFGLSWSNSGNRFNRFNNNYNGEIRTHFYADYLWHSFNEINSNFPIYYGIGGGLDTGPDYGESFGARGIIGIAWIPESVPLDVFIEVIPTLILSNSTGFGVDGGFGARYFF